MPPARDSEARALASELDCRIPIAHLLLSRRISTAEEADRFLHPSLDHLSDPFLLPDAEKAVDRLKTAIQNREKIAIHGDYDSDGVTSAALWMRLLTALKADVSVHVPHRRKDGYDLGSKFIAQAKTDGVEYEKAVFPWAASGRALSLGRDEGLTKLLFEPGSRRSGP